MAYPRWSYGEIRDPRFADTLSADPDAIQGRVEVELSDGVLLVGARQAFLNLYYWQVLVDFQLPVRKRHFIKYAPPSKDNMMDALRPYYEEILGIDEHHAKALKVSLWKMLQRLYELTSRDLLSYVSSIDIMDMASIMEDPPMKSIIDDKWKIKPSWGTDVIENYIDSHNKAIMKLMGTRGALKCDALYPYQQLRQLNAFQVPQTIFAFGVRTDIDDSIVSLPVIGSALDGLQNANEFAVESLSAKKSAAYNQDAVRQSQYFGRIQHLNAAVIRRIYPGDCGSTALVKFHLTASRAKDVLGKNIVVNGQMITLTEDNVQSYVGQDLMMRSPMTCRHRDGVCEVCGGRLFRNINRKVNIGMLSAVHVIEPCTQKILSAKHLIKTSSIIYEPPQEVEGVIMRNGSSELMWSPEVRAQIDDLMLGIPADCFKRALHDVTLLRPSHSFEEDQYTVVDRFILKKGEETKTYSLLSADNDPSQTPFLSAQMLLHMAKIWKKIKVEGDVVWIPLARTGGFPVMRTVVINDNMIQFVDRVRRFLNTDIKAYTDCAVALKAFSDIVYSKVSINLAHIEVLLKAYLIEGNGSYNVPIVTDPEHVTFAASAAIISNRTVGGKMGFERLNDYHRSVSTYLVPKHNGIFDLMVGYTSC